VIQYRRNELLNLECESSTNTSLWLDKYFHDNSDQDQEAKQAFVQEIVNKIDFDDSYKAFFTRWKKSLEQFSAQTREAHTLGRLVVNLGADSVLETNIALHQTYGVPFIPGSALKGLTSHFIQQNRDDQDPWQKGGEAHKIMFGDTDNAGYVTFFDALYVPNSNSKGKALWKDVITVHHAEYYKSGLQPPADWDSTIIIPFITTSGGFLIALAGPETWVEKAFDILGKALEDEGVGAKTSSGYGRMSFEGHSTAPSSSTTDTYEIDKLRLLKEQPLGGKYRGTVKTVKGGGSYGFIIPAHGGPDVFVHISQLQNKQPICEGQVVQYSKGVYKGKPQAQDVEVLLEK